MVQYQRIVIYWAEADGDRGWCYAASHDGEVDTAPIDNSANWSESQAMTWAENRFPGVPVVAGVDDII
jgi:hypothetical protein